MTSSWFFLSTLNYDARSTTHQIFLGTRYEFRSDQSEGLCCLPVPTRQDKAFNKHGTAASFTSLSLLQNAVFLSHHSKPNYPFCQYCTINPSHSPLAFGEPHIHLMRNVISPSSYGQMSWRKFRICRKLPSVTLIHRHAANYTSRDKMSPEITLP